LCFLKHIELMKHYIKILNNLIVSEFPFYYSAFPFPTSAKEKWINVCVCLCGSVANRCIIKNMSIIGVTPTQPR
jgi:hypothetical protein